MLADRRFSGLPYRLATLLLIGATGEIVLKTGAPTRILPPTVIARSPPVMGRASDYLLFLRAAARSMPVGSSVLVQAERQPATQRDSDYLIAVGQLPRQTVVSLPSLPAGAGSAPLPDFVAAFGKTLADPRYRPVAPLPGGFLYRKAS